LKEKVSKALSSLAIKAAPDEKVAETLSEKMTEDIPFKMSQLGVVAESEKVFQMGSYFVIKM
jgi:hypothetical protein